MKVYLVSRGSYSDYSVQAIFTDPALAEAHRHEVDEANDIEEYELLDEAPTRLTVYSMANNTYQGRGVDHEWSYLAWSYNRGLYKRADVSEGAWGLRVVGLDQKAVHKAYHDAKAKRQAVAEGLT